MSGFVVFITAGEYSDRQTVALAVCCDEQVAEAVKVEVEQEIGRLTTLAKVDDSSVEIEVNKAGEVVMTRWHNGGVDEPVRGPMATPRMDGFRWYTSEMSWPEVFVVEVPTIGPVFGDAVGPLP